MINRDREMKVTKRKGKEWKGKIEREKRERKRELEKEP